MEEEKTPSPEYIKGFNDGYILAKDTPELADRLSSIKNENERTQGFQDGRRQFVLEKAREQRPDRTKEIPTKIIEPKNRNKDVDRDR